VLARIWRNSNPQALLIGVVCRMPGEHQYFRARGEREGRREESLERRNSRREGLPCQTCREALHHGPDPCLGGQLGGL